MKNLISISCVVPVCNEAKIINKFASELSERLNSYFQKWEVLLIENGSSDGTAALVDNIALGNANIRCYHLGNAGYGMAIRTGLSKCSNECLFYIDADSPYDISYVIEGVKFLDDFDVVIGYPKNRKLTFMRQLGSSGWIWLINRLYGLNLRNINFPFKLIKKSVFEKIKLKSNHWFIDAEILIELKKQNARIQEIEIEYKPRTDENSKVTISLKTVAGVLKELFNYVREK